MPRKLPLRVCDISNADVGFAVPPSRESSLQAGSLFRALARWNGDFAAPSECGYRSRSLRGGKFGGASRRGSKPVAHTDRPRERVSTSQARRTVIEIYISNGKENFSFQKKLRPSQPPSLTQTVSSSGQKSNGGGGLPDSCCTPYWQEFIHRVQMTAGSELLNFAHQLKFCIFSY